MKSLGLDLGDQWTGIAISDALSMFARPLHTVKTSDLVNEITQLLSKESVNRIIVGLPKTMKGTNSEQTQKVIFEKERLEKLFPNQQWILWDERLSSKRAQALKPAKTKQEKLESHSVAAAFILQTYLDHLSIIKSTV